MGSPATSDVLVPGFVIIGRNEGPRLEQCLRSVLSHSTRVVYADSGSTDGSIEIAQGLKVGTVVLPEDGKLSAARGRNAGYAELCRLFPECNVVQFMDGDCILQPGWIGRGIDFLEQRPEVAVVCGRRFEAHPHASIYNGLCDREWDTPVGEAKECGGDALVRRVALDAVGGYRPSLRAGEEPEMTARMRAAGWKIWRLDDAMTEHDARILSFGQWWRRTRRTGFGYAQVWEATGDLPHRLYGRNIRSALVWAVLVPTAVLVLSLGTGMLIMLLLLPAAYGAQMARIARRSARSGASKWTDAALIQIAKIPEAFGAMQYLTRVRVGRAFDYKAGA